MRNYRYLIGLVAVIFVLISSCAPTAQQEQSDAASRDMIIPGGVGGTGSGDITAVGDASTGDVFTADGTGNTLYFEGSTPDGYETALTAADTTGSDKTLTLPNETGTVVTSATTLAGDVTGTPGATVVGDDSHNHTNYVLNTGADTLGAGSGFALTFDAGTTDPVFTFGDGTLTLTGINTFSLNSTAPYWQLENTTNEDTDGGRESRLIVRGYQSGGEASVLAQIQGSHDGTGDDENGALIFYTNQGSDGALPTEAMRLDSNQNLILPQEDSEAAPTFAFGDGDTGIYEGIDDIFYFSNGGVLSWRLTNSLFTTSTAGGVRLSGDVGTAASPTYAFSNDADTGIYRGGVNILGFTTAGVAAAQFNSTGEFAASYGIVPAFKTSDPCGSGFPEGAFFYNSTAHTWCGCDGTNDVKLSDGSACF